MSTEFNEWDWNNTDWNNGWTNNSAPQNLNRPPPKEISTAPQINQHNRGAPPANYYDEGWEEWPQPKFGQEVHGQTSSSPFSAINNNTLNQVENREIAPPDNNKHSYDSSKFKSKAPDPSDLTDQHFSNAPLASKAFPSQSMQQSSFKQPNQINDYFESKLINQNTTAQPKMFYNQLAPDNFNAQMISSGPSSFTNVFSPPHHPVEKDMGFSSLGHQVDMPQLSTINQMAQLPEVNQMAQPPAINLMAQLPTVNQMAQPPAVNQVPQPSAVNQMPQLPTVNQMPQPSAVNQMPQPPAVNQMPQPPTVNQMPHPPTVKQISPNNEGNQNIDNKPRKFTPPPQKRKLTTPPVQLQPPNTVHSQPNHYTIPSSEIQESNNFIKFSTPYQVANSNIAPIATSSPVANNFHLPENQERVPENREYLDNTESITQDLKALSINSAKEVEQETQRHCAIDRNQYLETGQFSSRKENSNYIQNTEINDEGEAPPPGLHRLVTGQGCEPWKVEMDPWLENEASQTPATPSGPSLTRQSSPLSSIGETESREGGDKDRRREVPGEAEPFQGRVVLGQVPTPPQDAPTSRGERERWERMVVGEQGQSGGNTSDDYRQPGRQIRHQRHRRNDSSYEEEERDYSSDRDRRNEDHRRRGDDRPRRRREHRSPEYRSDKEYEDRRGYHHNGRESSRRMRDYSPDGSYYSRDYYRDRGEDMSRSHRRYYGRDYDDYYRENQRSRPSSRSGSDYRHQMKPPGRMMLPGQYHPSPYYDTQSFDYNLKYSQRTAEYFERMRLVDPAGYAAWYSQYMQGRFMRDSSGRAFSSDRASVHSGQSSSNQRPGVSTPQDTTDDLTREEEVDYTPRLYDSAHIRGNMDGHGRLVLVDAHYPLDKQRATVNICRLSQLFLDKDSEDFFQSPGPFIPGVTHRNTVLQYLKRISDRSVKSSEKLLYDLIYMTVKGNGEVNGSDVAELLMESYKKSVQNGNQSAEDVTVIPAVSTKEIIARFRELLQQGNKTEALDWAIDNGAWGHALFLASKMDERTHNNIMLRFANSIPHNDPLQTLYQLMSGYVPQAATCCSDKKWSDWRPHLAMILSNHTGNPNLDRQAIITLGDSLNACGRLFASHFCYVTAQVEFSQFSSDAKLVLLGSSPNQEFSKFASCRAIMLTMCYEYGLKLRQPNYSIPSLQVYKIILAARLLDNGRIRNALQYCELLAQEILGGSTPAMKPIVTTVIDFASRLKMFDPVLALSGDTDKDPDWLLNLKYLCENLPDGHDPETNTCSPITVSEANNDVAPHETTFQGSDELQNMYSEPIPLINTAVQGFQQPPQPSHIPGRNQFQPEIQKDIYHHHQTFAPSLSNPTPMPSGYHSGQLGNNEPPGSIEITSGPEQQWEPQRIQTPVIQPPSETVQTQRNNFFKSSEEQLKADDIKPTMKVLNEVGGDKKKENKMPENKGQSKNEEQSGGWLGGIWGKISMRPKNQMRLPDDSNPSIIWDEKKKKWVNLDGESETAGTVKPPPKVSEFVPPVGSNKYKIQKGKLMKSNYVDVMGNTEKAEISQPPSLVPSMPPAMKTSYFIPPPVEGNENAPIDFLSPAPTGGGIVSDPSENSKQQLSRCSSVSSLSREVQSYMAPHQVHVRQQMQGSSIPPAMYNPSRYPS